MKKVASPMNKRGMRARFLVVHAAMIGWMVLSTGHGARAGLSGSSAQISGTITDNETGFAIAGASVSLFQIGGEKHSIVTETNGKGEYAFVLANHGRYRLTAQHAGYLRQSYSSRAETGMPTLAAQPDVGLGDRPQGINFKLARAGSVDGMVTDQGGRPISAVVVQVARRRSIRGVTAFTAVAGAQTNGQGLFQIVGIPPGNYFLIAASKFVFAPDNGEHLAYGPVFYPGRSRPEEAQATRVIPGAQMHTYNFKLVQASAMSLSGTVRNNYGRLVGPAVVSATRLALPSITSRTRSDAGGGFVLRSMVAGKYLLTARWKGQDGREEASTRTVELDGRTDAQVNFVVNHGTDVTGRIVLEDSAKGLNPAQIEILAVGDDVPSIRTGGAAAPAQPDFTFSLRNISMDTGRLIARFATDDYYVTAIYAAGQDIADREIRWADRGHLTGVEVIVSSGAAELRGSVASGSGTAPADTTVVLFSRNRDLRFPNSRFTKVARIDRQGRFALPGLVPGSYAVCAVTGHESGSEGDPSYLEVLGSFARTVTLRQGESMTVSLTPSPALAGVE